MERDTKCPKWVDTALERIMKHYDLHLATEEEEKNSAYVMVFGQFTRLGERKKDAVDWKCHYIYMKATLAGEKIIPAMIALNQGVISRKVYKKWAGSQDKYYE